MQGTGANHAILTKWIKHQLEVKLVSNLLRFSFCKKNFFMGRRPIIETITCALFWSISNKYVDEIQKGGEIMLKLAFYCQSGTVEDRNL